VWGFPRDLKSLMVGGRLALLGGSRAGFCGERTKVRIRRKVVISSKVNCCCESRSRSRRLRLTLNLTILFAQSGSHCVHGLGLSWRWEVGVSLSHGTLWTLRIIIIIGTASSGLEYSSS
jgi:hypothetical protein